MSKDLQSNPFAALFSTLKEAEQFQSEHQKQQNDDDNDSQSVLQQPGEREEPSRTSPVDGDAITSFLESLLLVTTREGPHSRPLVLLPDAGKLDTESLQFVMFERLLLESPDACLVGDSNRGREEAARSEVVVYLCEVYYRCWAVRSSPHFHLAQQVQAAVITNLATALEQPELYGGQQPDRQLIDVLLRGLGREAAVEDLTQKLLNHLADQGTPVPPLFDEVIVNITKKLMHCSLMTVDYQLVDVLDFYASCPHIAEILTKTPDKVTQDRSGRGYQNTPLGALLSISCLPKHPAGQFEFFEKPSSQPNHTHKDTENSIWIAQNTINARLHKIFYSLLKVSPKAKDGLLTWVESCLESNSGRAGLWHVQGGNPLAAAVYVSDGFMVNLGVVMLQLAQPFTQDLNTAKFLKIDPTYCSAPRMNNENGVVGAYTGDLGRQTTLIPQQEDKPPLHPKQYSFISSCFFLTHRALHLGVQVVQQKLHKLSQELGRMQHELQEASAQGSPATEMMRSHMETRTTNLLSFKAAIFEPVMVENLLQFLAATAEWLVQIALTPQDQPTLPTSLREVKAPLPEEAENHIYLACIPEFLVETLTETISAVRRYSAQVFESSTGTQVLPHLMSFIIVFMGSPHRMNNPHLRAHLAECLETLLPESTNTGGLLAGYREQLFTAHPAASHLVTALIHVFVSIEMTGQSVSFEDKFNYRRPMYEVMKYLWESPKHRKSFTHLADEALANMEAAKPPLFLRFVNLLMNDAIFLLDEGLSYMSQLRESQMERDKGDWASLPTEQRAERERNMQHMMLLARFHNMLGGHTIKTLIRLTREIPQMFTHSTLVDRMAAMLNYFLSTLVGPKQRNLKVRDMEKYEFRPGEIVTDICTIYTHLFSDAAFCLAVSADGRSYSPKLFSQAQDVLCRIGRRGLAEELQTVAEKVEEAGQVQAEEDDIVADAPEEFLDPIMSHLMTDPVILPSSKLTCDRQTIARHLLSDQTDPFNRQPLTMEEVQPNTELKNRIVTWLEEMRSKRRNMQKEKELKES